MKVKSESEVGRVRLLATPWTAAHQAPPSTGFSRQEYWSGVPLPSPFECILHYKYYFHHVLEGSILECYLWVSLSFSLKEDNDGTYF